MVRNAQTYGDLAPWPLAALNLRLSHRAPISRADALFPGSNNRTTGCRSGAPPLQLFANSRRRPVTNMNGFPGLFPKQRDPRYLREPYASTAQGGTV